MFKMVNPYFSIIMPHYHKTIPHDRFIRAIHSIKSQSFQDWELLVYHDGPIEDDQLLKFSAEIINDPRISFQINEVRHGDWGHSLRDHGIRSAKGSYIVNTNSDNVLYKNALAIIYAYSRWQRKVIRYKKKVSNEIVEFAINPDCLVYGIKMMGMLNYSNSRSIMRFVNNEHDFQTILTGWPPNKYSIDAMQLVAKRKLWEECGFWPIRHEESDGDIIQNMTSKYGYLVIPDILGEHW